MRDFLFYFLKNLLIYICTIKTCSIVFSSGSSLHTWDLTNRLTSYTAGLQTIDDDLSYLYGQLPAKIRDAAFAVMDKAERGVQTDVFVAGINILGTAFT